MTNMAVQGFPVLNCDIHNNIFGNCQCIGRGGASDDEEEEDECIDYFDDDDKDDVPPRHNELLS